MSVANRTVEIPDGTASAWRRRIVVALAVSIAAVALTIALDGWAYRTLVDMKAQKHDWARLLRVLGYWPTWLVLALAALLIDGGTREFTWPQTDRFTRAAMLSGSTGLGGLLAEVLKLVVRRERPNVTDGEYVFRAFADGPLSAKNLGMPSSHVAVAFAGAFVLSWLSPRARWVFLGMAAGCAMERVLVHAHFASDAAAGAVVGYGAYAILRRLHELRWEGKAQSSRTAEQQNSRAAEQQSSRAAEQQSSR